MEIRMGRFLQGAREAEGTAIIIDVFRAFTTAAVALSRGAISIALVAKTEEALELRRLGVGELCMGEVNGIRPEGFDFGNSPYEISQADVAGKRLIQSTQAGTVGVAAAHSAKRIYAGSLVIADATVKAVLGGSPKVVSIVAMGYEGVVAADEDEQCALYMRNLLQGRAPNHDAVQSLVLSGAEAQKYDDPAQPHFHIRDRDMALRTDSIPFAISVSREGGLLIARPESV